LNVKGKSNYPIQFPYLVRYLRPCENYDYSGLRMASGTGYSEEVKLRLDNLPASLQGQRQVLARCLQLMDQALALRSVYLFGSHARGEAKEDSDVDLCLVSEGAERQLESARIFREAIGDIWPCPSFSLLPITPHRLAEKQAGKDHFFATILKEGVILASEN
jgi:hypothetical protein